MSLYTEIAELVKQAGAELGREIDGNVVQEAAKVQARLLAKAIHEPGYRKALKSARNVVAMAAGIDIVGTADAADAKLLGILEGALGMAARVLGGLI